jgi:putative alpha-1,2-mannosidase
MTADGFSGENIYIQSVRLNNKIWDDAYRPYDELRKGGTIVFTMGPQPNQAWGCKSDIPH